MSKISVLALLIVGALAACSGGSPGGTPPTAPPPTPTSTPTTVPVSYTARLAFKGALAQAQIQGWLQRSPLADTTPVPIMVLSTYTGGPADDGFGGQVYAMVSPLPSTSPSVSYSTSTDSAKLSTPNPSESALPLPSGAIGYAYVNGTNATSPCSGTASATIGSPVNESPTTKVYCYVPIAVDCSYTPGTEGYGVGSGLYYQHFGWQWNGTSWTPDDNATTADVYIDGPSCVDVNSSETVPTIHIPGGDTRLSVATSFASVSATQWADSETSFTIADANTDGFVIGKTRDGSATFKWFSNTLEPFPGGMFGGIETSGGAPGDGF